MPVFPSAGVDPGDPGDLITNDYQYQFGNVLMGSGTPYVVEKISGFLGHAETRSKDIDRENSHGSIPGALLFSPRTIQFDVKVSDRFDGTPIESLLDAISTAFQPPAIRNTTDLQSFAYKRPGRDKRQFFGRATKFDFDSDFNVARGLAAGSVEIVANDPISYSLAMNSGIITHSIGEVSDSMVIANDGNSRNGTAPLLYIAGTCTNPRIENADDDGRELKLDVVIASNQICRVNMETFEVAIQTGGGSNPWIEDYSIVRDDSQWWQVMPGDNTITYQRTGSGAGSSLTIDWFDSWVRG